MPVKTLHVEIDKVHQGVNCSIIELLYLSTAFVFPLGIKMHFVHNYRFLTNSQVKAKAECLKYHQEQFLSQMDTCIYMGNCVFGSRRSFHGSNTTAVNMNIPDPANPLLCLFHSVNKMFSAMASILHFYPSHSQNVRDVVAGLCIYMKGFGKE